MADTERGRSVEPLAELDRAYRRYGDESAATTRWSAANPGNRRIHQERAAAFAALISQVVDTQAKVRVCEIGCGSGAVLGELRAHPSLIDSLVVGVDVLEFRLRDAVLPVVLADGRHLPFPPGTLDVVVMSTMMTSVLAPAIRAEIAREADSALRPGGALIWYDMRFRNPWNRSIRPVSASTLKKLFPGYDADVRSITLLPQLARRIGRWAGAYGTLSAVPLLRSHLVGVLRKPGRGG